MLSHPESNSKQKIIIQKKHPQKRYSVTVVTVFGGLFHLPLFRGNLLYIYI